MKSVRAILLLLLLSGCVQGPDYIKPAFEHNEQWLNDHKAQTQAGSQPVDAIQWWQQFNDPLLNTLILQASQHNHDLATALNNIESAKVLRSKENAAFLPTLDASGGANRNRFSRQTGFGANTGIRNSYSGSLDASWELDLFGRTRRTVEAADAQIGASQASLDGLKLSVLAEVAANYFELRGLQRQLQATRHDIKLLHEVEKIAQAQTELGSTSGLDLARAKGERQNIEANIPDREAEMMARIYRIAVLCGKAPEFYMASFQQEYISPTLADRIPVGLRSDILKRRPDIQLAEYNLAAASASIGIARADQFPSFSLTGAIGSSARLFSNLFIPSTLTGSLGAALGWPLFDGGIIQANIDIAEADHRAALNQYHQQVLLALEDTELALMRYRQAWQRLRLLRKAEQSRSQAFEIARLRYEAGQDSFMVILDAERVLITTRNDIINSEIQILTILTQLYKTLGGGWTAVAQSESKVFSH